MNALRDQRLSMRHAYRHTAICCLRRCLGKATCVTLNTSRQRKWQSDLRGLLVTEMLTAAVTEINQTCLSVTAAHWRACLLIRSRKLNLRPAAEYRFRYLKSYYDGEMSVRPLMKPCAGDSHLEIARDPPPSDRHIDTAISRWGRTALHYAAYCRSEEGVRDLLEHGTYVHATDS
ncbi:uncharacterized protein BO95DRAFT_461640 [Aspergillus brunneoviolaceus CBS 621.78]|uniref:Uncharacterized protein n=1 Tax=Aspergillus brunneoviolaceus CBS 621.78 TaxID=1450534 RepID=A0ACD1GF60_9EURO|nr:hypothetical protein BO95DRAFT_461640 [Aspergillus brunneoviolaceus CBS 621.78]RAH47893.1 hypothetical protein BO95DRAFT_461640 [Aspergillus brunneoviolaceus CBS 621.78]